MKIVSNVHQPDPATEVGRLSAGLSSLTRRLKVPQLDVRPDNLGKGFYSTN
jgi:hypothetical protein